MTLACISRIVDERVGVGSNTGDTGENIAERPSEYIPLIWGLNSPVQEENLFTTTSCPCLDAFSARVASASEGQIQELSCHFL